jgi:hypothetical protein
MKKNVPWFVYLIVLMVKAIVNLYVITSKYAHALLISEKKHGTSPYIRRKNWMIICHCLVSFGYSFTKFQL